ncbi:MAG TPA: radical SAM protein [Anaerolineae bacterium]|nr:radical SAM protein [Anaerolineae bacterium]
MSSAALQEALDAVTLWLRPPQVHFTGGEPFLHFDLLLDGVRWAVERGIVNYVETSASWCIDDEEVHQRLVTLREAGLEAVLISCSPFHAEKIPPARTLRAVQASLEVFGARGTIVYQPEYLQILQLFDIDRPTPLSRYEQEFGAEEAGRILWQGYGIISGGRAGYMLGHLVPRYAVESFAETNCMRDLLYAHHSHFDLYGNYISGFCGGLPIGSWRELHQILDDFRAGRYPPLIEVLIERGPYGLAKMAQENYGYQPDPAGYTGKCHLCVDVRRHLVRTGDFSELSPLPFYDYL